MARVPAASRGFMLRPPDGFGSGRSLTPRGSLTSADAAKAARLAAQWPALHAAAPSLQRLDEVAVATLAPILKPGVAVLGVLDPHAMDIDVHAVHHGYLRGLAARGGRVVLDADAGALTRTNGCWQVAIRDATWRAPVLVN